MSMVYVCVPTPDQKKKKKLLRDLCQSDLPLCPCFSSLTLAPQGSASPSGCSPQIWCGGAVTVSLLAFQTLSESDSRSFCSQLKKTELLQDVWVIDIFFFFFLGSLRLSDSIIIIIIIIAFVQPVVVVLNSFKKSSSVSVAISPSSRLPPGTLCRHRSSSSFTLPSKLTTSDSVLFSVWAALRN